MFTKHRNSRVLHEIGVGEDDGDVGFLTGSSIWPFCACAMKNMQCGPYLWPNRRNSCVFYLEIGVGGHDDDVRFLTGSHDGLVNSAMGQIPCSTERISCCVCDCMWLYVIVRWNADHLQLYSIPALDALVYDSWIGGRRKSSSGTCQSGNISDSDTWQNV